MKRPRSHCDRDSAFGDDDYLRAAESMFPTPVVAGTKRHATELRDDAPKSTQTTGPSSQEYPLDPQLCCNRCPENCPEAPDVRPAKRKASAHKVGEFHHATTDSHHVTEPECQFPDDCFEKFCQECNLEPSSHLDCSVQCPSDDCAGDDACFDPRCTQENEQCTDSCVDPDCTKVASPDQPCFCQKCNAPPCPMGDPNNECHFAHTAPTPVGTVYCYDHVPCHFQQGLHCNQGSLSSFETYPCFSPNHGYHPVDDVTTASSAPTPALSHSNYTSLESAFTSEQSPAPGKTALAPHCFLNITGDHCHIDNSCCHGPRRACGDAPSASQQQLDLWDASVAQGNGLVNNFMNFGFNPSLPTSPMSVGQHSIHSANPFSIGDPVLGFHDQSWMLTESAFPNVYQPASSFGGMNKLDFLASAVQNDILRPNATTPSSSSTLPSTTTPAVVEDAQACVCKWQHGPGIFCLAVFDNPEALHKHVKAAHVDNCAHCFCQWEGCEASAKDFKQRSKLSRHLLGHAGYRPYACSYEGCNKTFATNQAKDNHERTHTGERPYVCDRCGYTTTTHTQLQTHISALHEGKKPHKCRFCEFTCADSSNLSKHERTHQTLRPYRCPHENCTFKPDCRWENLKRHLRRSGHCPQLLVETSEEYKLYRESVRHEIDEWHKRNEDGTGKMGRRKGGRSVRQGE